MNLRNYWTRAQAFQDRGGDEMSAEASTNESHNARPGKKMTYSYRKDRLC